MLESEYKKNINAFHNKIMELPAGDIKYHLYLLLVALNDENSEYTRFILEGAIEFTESLYDFFYKKNEDEKLFIQLYFLNKNFETLINLAGTNSEFVMVEQALLNVGGSFSGLACGVVGGFVGGVCGFARGLWNKNIWEYSWTGVVTGGFIGSAIGFRTPKRLYKDPVFRQLKYALDGLTESFQRVDAKTQLIFDEYKKKAYAYILKKYFRGDENAFEDYLLSKEAQYEICTQGALFLSPVLAGSVGHHGYIRIPINDRYLGIEFSPSPSDYTKIPIQSEKRCTTGKKIVEMFAFHLFLQETDNFNTKYLMTKLKSGERDCMSYINKLLIGTSQEPTCLKRYHETDNIAGHMLGFFIENLATYPDVICFEEQDESRLFELAL